MKVVLSGGGTGGHVYPAIAIANKIKEKNPDAEILFIGTQKGIESDIVPKYNFDIKFIEVQGFRRKIDFENVKRVFKLIGAISKSKKILKKFNPDLVIGTGGYVSGPVLLAASSKKMKTCIHEQNSFPGMTNKELSKRVDLVMTSFEDSHKRFPENSKSKLVLTGNPVRDEILNSEKNIAREKLNVDKNKKMVLCYGGSGGSQEINDCLDKTINHMLSDNIAFVIATGRDYYDEFIEKYKDVKFNEDQKILPYIDDMSNVLAASDLVIGSAGAISLAEITALGKVSVIIPKAYTAENHQEYNAKSLEKQNAAVALLEKDLNSESLENAVFGILNNDEKMKTMAKNSKKIGKPEAIELIYNAIENNKKVF